MYSSSRTRGNHAAQESGPLGQAPRGVDVAVHIPPQSRSFEDPVLIDEREPKLPQEVVGEECCEDGSSGLQGFRRRLALFLLTTLPGVYYSGDSTVVSRMREFLPQTYPSWCSRATKRRKGQFVQPPSAILFPDRPRQSITEQLRKLQLAPCESNSSEGDAPEDAVVEEEGEVSAPVAAATLPPPESPAMTSFVVGEQREPVDEVSIREEWIDCRLDEIDRKFFPHQHQKVLHEIAPYASSTLREFWDAFSCEPRASTSDSGSGSASDRFVLGKEFINTSIALRFTAGLNPMQRRREETELLRTMQTEHLGCVVCNTTVPKDVMRIMFGFFGFGRRMLDTIGLVSYDWFRCMYLTWSAPVVARSRNLVLIPRVVLRNTTSFKICLSSPAETFSWFWRGVSIDKVQRIQLFLPPWGATSPSQLAYFREFFKGMKLCKEPFSGLRTMVFPQTAVIAKADDRALWPGWESFRLNSVAPNIRSVVNSPALVWCLDNLATISELKFTQFPRVRGQPPIVPLEEGGLDPSMLLQFTALRSLKIRRPPKFATCVLALLPKLESLDLNYSERLVRAILQKMPKRFVAPTLTRLSISGCWDHVDHPERPLRKLRVNLLAPNLQELHLSGPSMEHQLVFMQSVPPSVRLDLEGEGRLSEYRREKHFGKFCSCAFGIGSRISCLSFFRLSLTDHGRVVHVKGHAEDVDKDVSAVLSTTAASSIQKVRMLILGFFETPAPRSLSGNEIFPVDFGRDFQDVVYVLKSVGISKLVHYSELSERRITRLEFCRE